MGGHQQQRHLPHRPQRASEAIHQRKQRSPQHHFQYMRGQKRATLYRKPQERPVRLPTAERFIQPHHLRPQVRTARQNPLSLRTQRNIHRHGRRRHEDVRHTGKEDQGDQLQHHPLRPETRKDTLHPERQDGEPMVRLFPKRSHAHACHDQPVQLHRLQVFHARHHRVRLRHVGVQRPRRHPLGGDRQRRDLRHFARRDTEGPLRPHRRPALGARNHNEPL